MLEAAATDPQNNAVGQSEKPKSPPYPRLSEEACDPLTSSRGRIRELEDPLLERDAPKGTRRSSSAPQERFNSMFTRAWKFRARKNLWSSRLRTDISVV